MCRRANPEQEVGNRRRSWGALDSATVLLLDAQNLFELSDGLLFLAGGSIGGAHGFMGFGKIRVQPDGRSQVIERCCVPLFAERDLARQRLAIGIVPIQLQALGKGLRGARDVSGLDRSVRQGKPVVGSRVLWLQSKGREDSVICPPST